MTTGLWSIERAADWHRAAGQPRGVNYLPRTAVNVTAMWQSDTFDKPTIEQELAWASSRGYTSLRVFLSHLVWEDDPEGLMSRFETFLALAGAHALTVMPVLFDDCAFDAGREPYLGPQDDPIPGVHNSRWVPCPGPRRALDPDVWPGLSRYVREIVGRFRGDDRITVWDVYNEPGNGGMDEKTMPLVEATFCWAREAQPEQPLTAGAWRGLDTSLDERLMRLSDVVSFHCYTEPVDFRATLDRAASLRRPVICTEWLCRGTGNTFGAILPILREREAGWYHWGLVAGRTQANLPWSSKPGDAPPQEWQHDVLHADSTPYDPAEMDLVAANAEPPAAQ